MRGGRGISYSKWLLSQISPQNLTISKKHVLFSFPCLQDYDSFILFNYRWGKIRSFVVRQVLAVSARATLIHITSQTPKSQKRSKYIMEKQPPLFSILNQI